MMHYIESHGRDEGPLLELDSALLSRVPSSSHEEQRLLTAHDAIELARTMDISKIPREGTIATLPERQPRLNIAGLAVSVRPTNSISVRLLGRKEKTFGLLRPYLAKCQPLTSEKAALHGALLHWYAEENYQGLGIPSSELSFILDVFAQRAFPAPKTFKQRRKLLEASCLEIFDRWPAIKERLIEEGKEPSTLPYRQAE